MSFTVDDLADLENRTEESVVTTLRDRFLQDQIYTRIGHTLLVVVNPYKDARTTIQETSERYLAEYKNTEGKDRLPAHLFQHVNQAYFHMRRTCTDQSIVFSGLCGSGKSEMHQWALYHLVTLSNPKKPSKIQQLVQKAYNALESFGHAKTVINDNASRFGKHLELQFNDRGRMIGARFNDSMLEKSRVTQTHGDERNFHIFYYILHGSTADEKAMLHLTDPSSFTLLFKTKEATRLAGAPGLVAEDTEKLNELKTLLRSLGITKSTLAQLTQIVAAILHLGNLVFMDDITNMQDSAIVKNTAELEIAADLLGVEPKSLETCLTYQTKLIKRDLTTIFLNADQASVQRDALNECLYSLLFTWLVDVVNKKLNKPEFTNSIGLVDFPGACPIQCGSYDQFCALYANERLHHLMLHQLIEKNSEVYAIRNKPLPAFTINDECVDLLVNGVMVTLGQTSADRPEKCGELLKQQISHTSFGWTPDHLFTIQHFTGQVSYVPLEFGTRVTESVCADFVSLFGSVHEQPTNPLVCKLFQQKKKIPSMTESVDTVVQTLHQTKTWFVLCLRSNDLLLPHSCDSKKLVAQAKTFDLMQLVERAGMEYTIQMEVQEFSDRYVDLIHATAVDLDAEPREKCVALETALHWNENKMVHDKEKVYLTETAWTYLENKLRAMEKREQRKARCIAKGIPFIEEETIDEMSQACSQLAPASCRSMTEGGSISSDDYVEYEEEMNSIDSPVGDSIHHAYSEKLMYDEEMMSHRATSVTKPVYVPPVIDPEQKRKKSKARGCWVIMTWMMTWWIPSCLMSGVCGMRRADIRMAWREKVALCGFILLLCGAMIWFIAFFGQLVCPHQDLFTQSELQARSDKDGAYISIRGEVFDLTAFSPRHWASEVIPTNALFQYAGQDASDLFPVQVSALCDGIDGTVPKEVTLDAHINITDSNSAYHDFRSFRNDYRPDWYFEQMIYLRRNYRIGFMGYDPVDIKNQATYPVQIGGINTQRQWAIVHGNVYDLTSYMMGGRVPRVPEGQSLPANINMDFIDNSITELFRQLAGTDISAHFDALPLEKSVRERQLICLRNLFLVGKKDTRNSLQCLFSEYLLLLITGFLCSVILFKFLAALRLGSDRVPEEYDKFIICQVPCYTEGEESLRKTINSLAVLRYDDKRKLLFLIADGMIVGSGNDRSTPRIVLDILGVDPNQDPEPMSFLALGEGRKQHNMGKVYSGLYECSGHVVPYVVVVKVGAPEERQKPGNRGKRDSQMVLMRFLNKVHFDAPMTPLELEIHHQLKNVIGVNPGFYEFVLMVDADTEVLPDSLNRMVSCFVNDAKIVGLCGETMLSNEKDTWVTMIQVYEYYISHHLAKAFESLFGSVTCLPGCFCMYRIRSTTRNQPLLASNQVIHDYAENQVDTLHKKNLLHLGEDRYLTTLILKHFPNYKTKFTPDAACMTNAPDQWPVLLSQRRRWINSTVHNLGELMFLPELCGFCCFSMRFVVMLDLLSTLVMPAVVCYLGYLVYQLCTNSNQVPLMSIITLAGVYGLQAIIFILRRKWEHVGWMIVYILAIPVFSFLIPIYAFWHFDDFSWGNTRVVVGEKGQKVAVAADEGTFDPSVIPVKRWSEHEQEMLEEYDCEKSMTKSSHYSSTVHSSGRPSYSVTPPPYPRVYSSANSIHTEIGPRGSGAPSVSQTLYTLPSDRMILQEIERILDNHDLMHLTKKQVRDTLSDSFGVNMASKKDYINKCIDQLLAVRL
ncbi:chitin synthase [Pilobolus umbonatus]|nr:chitin synthase [Pilobolus umbonatus]